MGGHGGLNILPQKKWNVYNFDNREKVKRDEEAAARDEQIGREQARKREAESRLERLRMRAHGADPSTTATTKEAVIAAVAPSEEEVQTESDSKHMNLFEGIKIFDPVVVGLKRKESKEEEKHGDKRLKREAQKMKKEAEQRVVGPEDEKYRLGYGIAGKDVKAPWYMTKPSMKEQDRDELRCGSRRGEVNKEAVKSNGKRKTLEELREERLKRENKEKERVRALMREKTPLKGERGNRGPRDKGYSRQW